MLTVNSYRRTPSTVACLAERNVCALADYAAFAAALLDKRFFATPPLQICTCCKNSAVAPALMAMLCAFPSKWSHQ